MPRRRKAPNRETETPDAGSPATRTQACLPLARRLDLVLDATREGILGIDRAGRCTFANKAAASMLGYSPDDLIGRHLHALVHHSRRDGTPCPAEECPILESLRTGRPCRVDDDVFWRGDGKSFSVEYATRVDEAAWPGDGAILVFSDTTQRKEVERRLLLAASELRAVFTALPDLYLWLDSDGVITHYRAGSRADLHLPPHLLLGRRMPEVFPPAVRRQLQDAIARVQSTRSLATTEYSLATQAGEQDYEARLVPLLQGHVLAVIRNISERRGLERERERLLRREQALASIGQSLVSDLELEAVAETVTDQSLKVLGVDAVGLWLARPRERVLTLLANRNLTATTAALLERVPFDARTIIAEAACRRETRLSESPDAEAALVLADRLHTREGMRSILAAPLLSRGHLVGVIAYLSRLPRRFSTSDLEFSASVTDLFAVAIENAHLHRDLREHAERIDHLLKATIDAQEEERQRIGLEIHDGVAQTLAAAFQHLQAIASSPELPAALRPRAEAIAELVRGGIRDARAVIQSLRPAALETLGLVATLRLELENRCQEAGLELQFVAEDARYPDTVEAALYRMVQEATTNALKHARASHLNVSLLRDGPSLVATIQDDGCGFVPEALATQVLPKGYGLLGLRKRAEQLGGKLEISSRPGKGTTLRISIPLPQPGRTPGD
mgnify:CR=1 FL=1